MNRLLAVVAFLTVAAAQAQPSCPTAVPDPYGFRLTTACDPCLAGQPVTFTLVPNDAPCVLDPYKCPNPYSIQACDTVAWAFGDGASTTVAGSASATHTYASGNGYEITVAVTNAKAPTPFPRTFEVTVGNSSPTTITVSLPPTASEAGGELLVNLTRSGNLGVASSAEYRLQNVDGTKRLEAASGEVHFAAGDTQRVLSFPLLGNDTIFTGRSTYFFYVESDDGTLLAGLPKVFAYPTEVRGRVEVFDDEPWPRLRLHDLRVVEGDAGITTARVKATLDLPSGLYSSFSGTIAGADSDVYNGHAGFWFTPGQTVAEGTLMIKGDIDPEPDEVLTFALNTTSVGPDFPIIERGSAAMTIVNDDIGFGLEKIWLNVGESVTLPVDLGNPLAAGAKLTFTPDLENVVALEPSLSVGSAKGTIKIDALRGGATIVTAHVDSANVAAGTVYIDVFQPSTLVANPAAVQLRVGDETTLRVSFAPAQPSTAAVQVQPEKDGVVAVLNTLSSAPAGGEALVKLRGLAPGKTSLIVFSLGQPRSTSVPVEVVPGPSRRRAARP